MAQTDSLRDLISRPPRYALEALREKGYRIGFDWEDSLAEAHNRAFTVAQAARADVLQAVRQGVDRAIAEGQTQRQFAQNLEPVLKLAGWWGKAKIIDPETGEERVIQEGSPHRLRTIYRTNMQTSFARGREKWAAENAENLPYAQYNAVMDGRTRPSHAALHGKVFRVDDPFWLSFSPPLGFNCRCRKIPRSQRWVDRNADLLESSQGKLGQTLRQVSARSGALEQAATYTTNVDGRDVTVTPDRGWSRNWEPDLDQYSPEIRLQLERALAARREAFVLPTGVEVPANGRGRYRAESEAELGRVEAAGYRVLRDVTRNGGYVARRGKADPVAEQYALELAKAGSRVILEGDRLEADGQVLVVGVLWRVLAGVVSGLLRLIA